MTTSLITPHQSQFYAWQLTRRAASDSVEALASTLVNSQVDVETDQYILMAETKAKDDMNDGEVKAKADAAIQWCKHASDYAQSVGGKPWKYLLVPHDGVSEAKRLVDYLQYQL